MIGRLILFVLISVNAWAIPFGQDTLGAAKYQKVLLDNLPRDQGQGHFANTFGDILPLIKEEAKAGVPFIRIQLGWRDDHNFTEKDFPGIVKEAKRLCPVVKNNRNTRWYFSGACEHRMKEGLARKLAKQVKEACPEATYVNTPIEGGAVLHEYINETHGHGSPKSAKYAYSFDGTAAEDSDVEAIKRKFPNAEYFMIWGPRYNGRWETNDSTPRPKRTGWPDAKYIKSMVYLTGQKGKTSLPKNWLWKSHSENKGNGDIRAEKPVAIIPIKTNTIELKVDKKVVEIMKYFGSYSDGRSRYYATRWGYEIGKVDAWVKGKKQGNVNAGFRDGSFR